jgi:hypothetical protein
MLKPVFSIIFFCVIRYNFGINYTGKQCVFLNSVVLIILFGVKDITAGVGIAIRLWLQRLVAAPALHCPKRLVYFNTDGYGRWAPAANSENFHS